MITNNEAWMQQTCDNCLQACAAIGDPTFNTFAQHALKALLADELRRYTPQTLSACFLTFWRFVEGCRQDLQLRVFNPQLAVDGWRSEGTVIELYAGELPFLLNTLRIALQRGGHDIQVLLDLSIPLRRDKYFHVSQIPSAEEAYAHEYRTMLHIELSECYDGEELIALEADIQNALTLLQRVVGAFPRMQTLCREAAQLITDNMPKNGEDAVSRMESHAFLQWLLRGHFTFLAAMHRTSPTNIESVGLDNWSNPRIDWLDDVKMPDGRTIYFGKSLTRAPIHHDRHIDVIIIRLPNNKGEYRFLGLYTSRVQQHDPMTMPVLRHKLSSIDLVSGFRKLSNEGRNFDRLLRTHPRDELLLASDKDLLQGFLPLVKQKYGNELRFIWRIDQQWKRFVSVFIFLPKPLYNEAFVSRTAEFLQARFNATDVHTVPFVSEHRWIRLNILLMFPDKLIPHINTEETESVLKRLARTWDDELQSVLLSKYPPLLANQLFRRYQQVFPETYRSQFRPQDAVMDIGWLETLLQDNTLSVEVVPAEGRAARFKLLQWHQQLSLSKVMPILESFGLRVLQENAYALLHQDSCLWLHDFRTELPELLARENMPQALNCVREAMQVVWRGEAEVDVFNRLITLLPCRWRDVQLFRALSAYLQQIGFPLSAQSQAEALTRYPAIGRALLEYMQMRFDPALSTKREQNQQKALQKLDALLDGVSSLVDDRILRQFKALLLAMVRTNLYLPAATRERRLAFKFASQQLSDVPQPRPWREVFVYAPEVIGVHLRFGPVARGGIRWSDRPEDFRTEVLGLVKAQQVKNAVIVPVGAKGGFIVRDTYHPDARQAGVDAYQVFLKGLLDITDNREQDKIVTPSGVVRHEDTDPYLVVAADKGTATFSDTANQIAASYNFWLGDAFASGGSNGYDHKKMGITARGAFVSMIRLAKECGFDPRVHTFTMVGIGDMSGDVFGNGLLRTQTVKLVAAFNHSHIFLDPNPDPERSYAERERLFNLPRSSWTDYDRSILSEGGAIYSRHEKRLTLTPALRTLLDITATNTVTPDEVIRAILSLSVDVIWNGGIGTYIKSSEESHDMVGDRSNDSIRINGQQLRTRIFCEGGNLGMTQRGRIEYQLNGGRCHTDAIDNSAGVDCSDHEVNIKIFLQREQQAGRLSQDDYRQLLSDWRDSVATAVLADNKAQTQSLAIAASQAALRHKEYAELADFLEAKAGLDRRIEALPDVRAWQARALNQQPLTRPELAVLFAYSKNWLKSALAVDELAKDPYLLDNLKSAFPSLMQMHFATNVGSRLLEHPLAIPLAATRLASEMTERLGMGAIPRLLRSGDVTPIQLARVFVAVRQLLQLDHLWQDLSEVSELQLNDKGVLQQCAVLQKATRRACDGLLSHRMQSVADIMSYFSMLPDLLRLLPQHLNNMRRESCVQAKAVLIGQGLPEELSSQLAVLDQILPLLDVCRLTHTLQVPVQVALYCYVQIEEMLGLTEVQRTLQDLSVSNTWEAEARDQLRSGLLRDMARLTHHVLSQWQADNKMDIEPWLASWLSAQSTVLNPWRQFRSRLHPADLNSYAPYVVLRSHLDELLRDIGA